MKKNISEKDSFFSKISHDLRGSFTSILGFSDIVNDPDEELSTHEIKEYVNRIGKQSHDTYDLLVNFINWLKLEKYNYGLNYEDIELVDVLFENKEQLKNKINSKNIIVNIDIDEQIKVHMDYEILSSIFKNILLFLINICDNHANIRIKTSGIKKLVNVEIFAKLNEKVTVLQNLDLRDLNNELSFPIIFAIKFTELCKGEFNFNFTDDGEISLLIGLPQNR